MIFLYSGRCFSQYLTPVLKAREMSRLRRHAQTNKKDAFTVKVVETSTSSSVSAQYTHEDLKVELEIQVPQTFPLEPVDVAGGRRLGISEGKWRTWLLSCKSLFRSDSINVLEGLLLWKDNVEKSLEGIEPCPICYCVFHASDKSLPGPSCKTCNNKYHPSCLYKWFKTSGNSTCPMCRAVF